jgi:hypothetical protein
MSPAKTENSRRRALAIALAIAVLIIGIPAVAAVLFFPVMYLAGAHTGVLSGALAGAVWVAGVAAAVALPAWLALRIYRRVMNSAPAVE